MAEAEKIRVWLRVSGAQEGLLDRVERRLAERMAHGIVAASEIERVTSAELMRFDLGDGLSDAFRRCCADWETDRPVPITSHRPWLGVLLVGAKKALARVLRYQNEPFLRRQREFNRHLLLLLRELVRRTDGRADN
jgi:hypothetical protein